MRRHGSTDRHRRRPDRARRPSVGDGAVAGRVAGARAGRAAPGAAGPVPASSVRDAGDVAIEPGFRPDPDPRAKNRAAICAFLPRERDLVATALGAGADRARDAAADPRWRLHRPRRGDGGPARGTTGRPATRSPGSMRTATSTRPTRRRRATSGGCRSRCSAAAATRTWWRPPTARRSWSRTRRCSAGRSSTRPSRGCSRRRGSRSSGPGCSARTAGLAAVEGWARSVATRVDGIYIAFDMDCLDGAGGWAVTMPEPDGLALETAVAAIRVLAAAMPVVGFGATGGHARERRRAEDRGRGGHAGRGGLRARLRRLRLRRLSRGTVAGSRITAPGPGRSDAPGSRPVARPIAIRSGPACETTTTSSPAVDQVAPGGRDPVGQLGRAFAAGPVDLGLAVREPAGEVGREALELIEGEALGDPEIGLAPAVVDRDVVDAGRLGDGRRRRLRAAQRARHDARAGRQGRGELAGQSVGRRPARVVERRVAAPAVATGPSRRSMRGGRG